MHERELLDLLAGGAPEPSTGLSDRVVAAGRRVRRRRRAGAGAVAGVVVAAGLVFVLPRSGGPARTVADPSVTAFAPMAPKSLGPAEPSRPKALPAPRSKSNSAMKMAGADPRVRIYESVIGKALGPATPGTAQSVAPVYVVDRTCPLRGACTGPVFDDGLKSGLAAALEGNQVSFGPETNATVQSGPVVRLGEIKLTGNSAVVPVSVMSPVNGFGAGSGTTYQLRAKNGRWSVVGTTGPSWTT